MRGLRRRRRFCSCGISPQSERPMAASSAARRRSCDCGSVARQVASWARRRPGGIGELCSPQSQRDAGVPKSLSRPEVTLGFRQTGCQVTNQASESSDRAGCPDTFHSPPRRGSVRRMSIRSIQRLRSLAWGPSRDSTTGEGVDPAAKAIESTTGRPRYQESLSHKRLAGQFLPGYGVKQSRAIDG